MDVEATLFQVRYHVRADERILEKAAELTDEQLRGPASLDYETVFETLLHMAIVDWSWRELLIGNDDDDSYPDGWPPADLATLTAFWDEEHARLASHVGALDERALEQPFTWQGEDGPVTASCSLVLAHIFNHGTQHRSELARYLPSSATHPATSTSSSDTRQHAICRGAVTRSIHSPGSLTCGDVRSWHE